VNAIPHHDFIMLAGDLTGNALLDSERSTYTQKVDFAKLRSELLNADSTEAQLTRSSHEKIAADLAKLNSRLRDEIGRTQASVRLDLNLEKGRIREEANSQEMRIKETETRIEQEVAGLRERVEAVKFSTLQWLMYDPRTILTCELMLTFFSFQGCLYRYCGPYSWCLALVYVIGAKVCIGYGVIVFGSYMGHLVSCNFSFFLYNTLSHSSNCFMVVYMYYQLVVLRLEAKVIHCIQRLKSFYHGHLGIVPIYRNVRVALRSRFLISTVSRNRW
jgi:hypothetical protein